MSYEQRDMSGVLFKNDRKQKDSQPDYTGNAMIEGTVYDISAWLKESKKNGKKFFSFSFRERDQGYPRQKATEPAADAPADDFSDEIPFSQVGA